MAGRNLEPCYQGPSPQESTSDQPKASPGGLIGLTRRIRDVTLKSENLYYRPQVSVSAQRLGNDDKNLPDGGIHWLHAIVQQIPKNRSPEYARTMTANVAFQLNSPLANWMLGVFMVMSITKSKKGKRLKNSIIEEGQVN